MASYEHLGSSEGTLRQYVSNLRSAVALQPRPIEEARKLYQFERCLLAVHEFGLIGYLIPAAGVDMPSGQTVSGHRAITELALAVLADHRKPYHLQDFKLNARSRSTTTTAVSDLHLDPTPPGLYDRINVNHTVQGSGDVLLGLGTHRLFGLQQRELAEQWEAETGIRTTLLALREQAAQGNTLPDLMAPDVLTATLQPGDTLIFSERTLEQPGEAIWHGFGTSQAPRETRIAYIALAAASGAEALYEPAQIWDILEQFPR